MVDAKRKQIKNEHMRYPYFQKQASRYIQNTRYSSKVDWFDWTGHLAAYISLLIIGTYSSYFTGSCIDEFFSRSITLYCTESFPSTLYLERKFFSYKRAPILVLWPGYKSYKMV